MRSRLESLANELIHEVFDYLSSIDLIQSFCQLNKRFTHLLAQRFLKCDFSHLSKSQYESIQQILPFHQIQSLKISNQWTINLFLRLPIHQMYSLQNLILSHINYTDLRGLFESNGLCQQLQTLKIQSTNRNSLDRDRLFVLKRIFSLTNLRICQIPLIDIHDLDEININTSLEIFRLDHCTITCLGKSTTN